MKTLNTFLEIIIFTLDILILDKVEIETDFYIHYLFFKAAFRINFKILRLFIKSNNSYLLTLIFHQ